MRTIKKIASLAKTQRRVEGGKVLERDGEEGISGGEGGGGGGGAIRNERPQMGGILGLKLLGPK